MFNIGLKRQINRGLRANFLGLRRNDGHSSLGQGQKDQMETQVKKILEQKEQGLILMVRG